MRMRTILLILAIHIGCIYSLADVEHTIERGETLESIAKLYGVTPEAILKANPIAKDMFYAGMVLTIVTDKNLAVSGNSNSSIDADNGNISFSEQKEVSFNSKNINDEKIQESEENKISVSEEESLFAKGKNFYGFQIGYFFPKENKSSIEDIRTNSYGFSMMYSLRVGRYIIDNLFGDINVGFSMSSFSMHQYNVHGGKLHKWVYDFYTIPVNFHLGYTIPFNQRSGLSLYTGPMICFPVGSKYKVDGEKEDLDIKTKTTFDWDFGVELNLASWIIGGRYTIAMNSKEDNPSTPKGIWMVYIGCVF